ncbi:MAG TPA: hypothetical protein VGQ73_01920 [Gemmatimonadales bacterium]|nr:hypothetical protein [Gemmatimonadales bacterium]
MRQPRILFFALLGTLLGVAACSADHASLLESPAPSFDHGGIDSQLLSCSPLPYSKTSATIGPQGGSLSFGPHTLVVPKDALGKTVTITAEIISGSANSVRFSPEGLQFSKGGAALTLSYSNCSGLGMLLPKQVAYTDEYLYIESLVQSVDLASQKKVTGQLKHFSRYAVAY